ncbi:MAG: simple sugar transport system permease protein [Gaiellales bacterium]|jgi:simple sugar transport system permease protein|nr:simple sugar transport system permease protein [Gaiellales bacterium]
MTDAAIEHAEIVRRSPRRVLLGSLRELALVPAIAVLFVAGIFTSPAFFTTSNLSNTAQFSAALGLVVVAESLILLTGSFDLSLQSIYGLAPMIGAWLIVPKDAQGLGTHWNPAIGILVVMGIGAAVGLFNGFMIVKLRFNAFIFTLAMLILIAGLQQGIVSGRTIYDMPPSFIYLGSAYWGGFPVSAWMTAAAFLIAGLFLRYHRTGRAIYAIGGNLEAARAAGIKVDRIRIAVFTVAGMLAGIAGLMIAGQVVAVTANQGNNLIFTVFAAAVIGGIELEGGRGRMIGAFTGVVLLGLVNNVLVLRNTSTFWIDAANGAIILIALGLARVIGTVRT